MYEAMMYHRAYLRIFTKWATRLAIGPDLRRTDAQMVKAYAENVAARYMKMCVQVEDDLPDALVLTPARRVISEPPVQPLTERKPWQEASLL